MHCHVRNKPSPVCGIANTETRPPPIMFRCAAPFVIPQAGACFFCILRLLDGRANTGARCFGNVPDNDMQGINIWVRLERPRRKTRASRARVAAAFNVAQFERDRRRAYMIQVPARSQRFSNQTHDEILFLL